ncbi:hypothetical protein [Terrimonas sp.]|uniref:hypothetical protein n=1 Tax=Terrimonas sp. TaxID=1914338 RepID=UPI001402AA38|nr:hypothetical protein [Terrimonas sp.]
METTEVIKKHEKRFNRIRVMVKFLLIVLFAGIIALQWNHIIQLLKSVWTNI